MSLDIDYDELEIRLLKAVAGVYLEGIDHNTPMHEVRKISEAMGVTAGRVLGAAFHEGPIDTNIAMEMRRWETEMVERCLNSTQLYGPGGELREYLVDRMRQE